MIFIDDNIMSGTKLFVSKYWYWSLSTKTCDSPRSNFQI